MDVNVSKNVVMLREIAYQQEQTDFVVEIVVELVLYVSD